MKHPILKLLMLATVSAFTACTPQIKADLLLYNGVIYTVDSGFTVAEAMVVREGKIIETGNSENLQSKYDVNRSIDLHGKAVYPGLIDAHCHFYGYGGNLLRADLTGTRSFEEVLERVVAFSKTNSATWILGRGWDQNDWEVKEFPDRSRLDALFPNIPVLLKRIDGHAALANGKALELSGITAATKVSGGEIILRNGRPTGLLVDNAVDLVQNKIPVPDADDIRKALLAAQADCFKAGLTTVDDAGLDRQVVDIIRQLHDSGSLKMRIYAMLNPSAENFENYVNNGLFKSDRLNVRSVKVYADGALGSRGACLLHPYHDQPGNSGFLLTDIAEIKRIATLLEEKGYQMNTHCIGDSANRLLLDIYAAAGKGNALRWRIEHAQVMNPADFEKFTRYHIIPSVQPTHATSDMEWADERLGAERISTAYAYRTLLQKAGTIALGTDFPVEYVNPMFTFYAAVSRQDAKGNPAGGFQSENALTREEALKGMTIWAAYANFEEKEKGSLQEGKFADFIILDTDIMKAPLTDARNARVLSTFVNGEEVYTAR